MNQTWENGNKKKLISGPILVRLDQIWANHFFMSFTSDSSKTLLEPEI